MHQTVDKCIMAWEGTIRLDASRRGQKIDKSPSRDKNARYVPWWEEGGEEPTAKGAPDLSYDK